MILHHYLKPFQRHYFCKNRILSFELLGVFIALILIDGVIILILGSDRYHFNLGQLFKILIVLTKWFLLWWLM